MNPTFVFIFDTSLILVLGLILYGCACELAALRRALERVEHGGRR